jgi:putative phosphoribosyl transferase
MGGFRDRADAGAQLARALGRYQNDRPVVLALPRGGVPVGFEIARAFGAPLDVIVVRKLGVPDQPELAMGAIGEEGTVVVNERVLRVAGVSPQELAAVEERERTEVERRARRFRGDRAPLQLEGRTAIVVDDGIATGSTARAALDVARAHGAARVVLAVPVAPPESLRELARHADDVVALATPASFVAVGQWYGDFTQVSEVEVNRLLAAAAETRTEGSPAPSG